MSIPFHKQTDPNKQAGQHVYGFDREPYLKHSNAAPYEPRVEQTLNEYIKRKTDDPKKITFDEWFAKNEDKVNDEYINGENIFKLIWNAALTKGKL